MINKNRIIIDKIERLKAIESAYQISKDWYNREKLTEKEYYDLIGEWKDLTPFEIINIMVKFIQEL